MCIRDRTEIVPDDTAILVHLVYATPENFTGKVLYTDLRRAYLLPEAARMLYRASACLRRERPGLRLLIYDAARPMSVPREMWNLVKGTPQYIYVSNPDVYKRQIWSLRRGGAAACRN